MPYKDRETYLCKQREFAARRKIRKRIASAIQTHVNPALTRANLKGIPANNQAVTHTRMRRNSKSTTNSNRTLTPTPQTVNSPKCVMCGDTGLLGGSIPCPRCDAGLRATLETK
jgi:hypothetical protein